MWTDEKNAAALVGRTVRELWADEDHVTFVTDDGSVTYAVYGDCCSRSYFHDIVGADKLLAGGPVTELSEIDLQPGDVGYHDPSCVGSWGYDEDGNRKKPECGVDHDSLAVYGYRIVSDHPEWGEVTTVLSFRNDSNGYYGGWMELHEGDQRGTHRVTDSWVVDEDAIFD